MRERPNLDGSKEASWRWANGELRTALAVVATSGICSLCVCVPCAPGRVPQGALRIRAGRAGGPAPLECTHQAHRIALQQAPARTPNRRRRRRRRNHMTNKRRKGGREEEQTGLPPDVSDIGNAARQTGDWLYSIPSMQRPLATLNQLFASNPMSPSNQHSNLKLGYLDYSL